MEPANLNRTPAPGDSDARLEALLRAPSPQLPDDGFSVRVLAALPPTRRTRARLSRNSACFVGAILGILFALAGSSSVSGWDEIVSSLNTAFAPAAARLSDPAVLAAIVVALASAVYALRPSFRRTTT